MTTFMLAALFFAATPPAKLDPTSQTLLNMRVSAAVLQSYLDRQPEEEEAEIEHMTLDAFASRLAADEKRLLVTRDGWNRPLRLVIGPAREHVLMSYGADGKADLDYERLAAGYGREHAPLAELPEPSSPDRDIMFMDCDFVQRPESARDRRERTLADLRALATAVEAFAVDSNVYPGPTDGVRTIEAIAPQLESIYIRTVPRLDAWGRPFLVWSDGTSYVLVSAGEDGVLDQSYIGGYVGPTTDDLCFKDGQLVDGKATD